MMFLIWVYSAPMMANCVSSSWMVLVEWDVCEVLEEWSFFIFLR